MAYVAKASLSNRNCNEITAVYVETNEIPGRWKMHPRTTVQSARKRSWLASAHTPSTIRFPTRDCRSVE